jgi:hypothetical protein
LPHLQLSNEEAVLRMQRHLRVPLSVLAGLAGTRGPRAAGFKACLSEHAAHRPAVAVTVSSKPKALT